MNTVFLSFGFMLAGDFQEFPAVFSDVLGSSTLRGCVLTWRFMETKVFHIVLSSGSTEEVHIGCRARVADLQKAYRAHGGRFLRLVTQDGRLLEPRQGSTVGFKW